MLGYKYRAINKYSLDTIENDTIYFSAYTDFNDPFEFSTPFPNLAKMYKRASAELDVLHTNKILDTPDYLDLKNICINIIKNGNPDLDITHSKIRERLKKVGIYSLSKVNDEILMWSHYADNHKGFCMGFEDLHRNTTPHTKSFPISYKETFTDLDDPEIIIKFYTAIYNTYKSLPPKAWEAKKEKLTKLLQQEDDRRGGLSVLTDKYHKWSYEQEFRLVDEKNFGLKKFKPQSLKSITFGLRTTQQDIDTIIDTCMRTNKENIEFFQTRKSEHSFKLDIASIKL